MLVFGYFHFTYTLDMLIRSYRNGDLIEMSPESSVEAQKALGADLIIPLDILLAHQTTPRKLIESFHRTHRYSYPSYYIYTGTYNNASLDGKQGP